MNNKIEKNPTWVKQSKALKKQQIHFSFMSQIESDIRIDAAKKGENPSNTIRRILDLDVKSPVRPRLGVSLTDAEISDLAKRFNIEPDDRKSLTRRATEVINLYYKKNPTSNDL